MPLTPQTQKELEDLAQGMLGAKTTSISYRNFGTLVQKNSKDYQDYENEIALGSVEVDGVTFILFN